MVWYTKARQKNSSSGKKKKNGFIYFLHTISHVSFFPVFTVEVLFFVCLECTLFSLLDFVVILNCGIKCDTWLYFVTRMTYQICLSDHQLCRCVFKGLADWYESSPQATEGTLYSRWETEVTYMQLNAKIIFLLPRRKRKNIYIGCLEWLVVLDGFVYIPRAFGGREGSEGLIQTPRNSSFLLWVCALNVFAY